MAVARSEKGVNPWGDSAFSKGLSPVGMMKNWAMCQL